VDPSETPEGKSLRKQGFSKDKSPDLVQIVIGLAVTRERNPYSRLGMARQYNGHDSHETGETRLNRLEAWACHQRDGPRFFI
jgi:hypothetical protein